MNEWELTDEEIIEATRVDELDGYLTGRQQVAKASNKKLMEWLNGPCEHFDETVGRWDCAKCYQNLKKGVGID